MTYEITRIGQPAKERLVEHEVLNELLLADDEQDNHRFGVEVMEHLLHLTEEGQ